MIKLFALVLVVSFISAWFAGNIQYQNGYTDGARIGINTVIKACATPGQHS
jgi:hypothetical protein